MTNKEPTTRNCFGCKYSKDNHNAGTEECHECMWDSKYSPKNDLGVDCISRKFMYELGATCIATRNENGKLIALGAIEELPSVTPQLSSGLEKNSKKLEKDFGELDCILREDVLKLMKDNWHTHNGDWAMQESMDDIRALPTVTLQEPFKPMVEIDLYSVIKQKYIEREVLDKIRAEIEKLRPNLRPEQMTDYDYAMVDVVNDIVAIIDKYKAESEGNNG